MKILRVLSILLMTGGLSGVSIQPAAKDFSLGSARPSASYEPLGTGFLLSTYDPTSSLLAFYDFSPGAFRGYPNLDCAIKTAHEGRVALMKKLDKPVGLYVDLFKFADKETYVVLRLLTTHKLGKSEGGFLETLKLNLYRLPSDRNVPAAMIWHAIEHPDTPGKTKTSLVAFQDALLVYSLEQQVKPEKISAGLRVFFNEDISNGVLNIVSITRDDEVVEQPLLLVPKAF